ncbi:hypothetical protein [Sphingobacterium sp. HMA12]|uniref:hypothetical protein n=1 Tax=Sphingobacterium sp. HMA12 TaxID=2050894 RepID=UPI00131587FC|nr:hypothetical protein [Sphingobacterium sp. HMA12]
MTRLKLLVILGGLSLMSESCRTDAPTPICHSQLNSYTVFEKGDTSTFRMQYDNLNRIVSYNCPEEDEFMNFGYDLSGRLNRIDMIDAGQTQKMVITYSKNGEPVSAVVSIMKEGTNRIYGRRFIDYEMMDGKVVGMKVLETGGSSHEIRLDYSGDDLVRVTLIGNAGFVSHEFELGRKRSPFASTNFRHILSADLPLILCSTKEYTGHTIILSEGMTIPTKIENHTDPNGTYICIKEPIEIPLSLGVELKYKGTNI